MNRYHIDRTASPWNRHGRIPEATIRRTGMWLACLLLTASVSLGWAADASAMKPNPKRRGASVPSSATARQKSDGVRAIGARADSQHETTEAYPPGKPRPKIDAGEGVHDFGTIWMGPVLQHSFMIKNAGEATLEIKNVKPSCGCTIAGKYPKTLPPGDTGEFPFSVASTKLRGRFEKAITVTTNDPATPQLRLRLRGEVKRYVDMVPAAVHFGKLFGADTQERVIKITNNTEDPLRLKVSQPLDGTFKSELVEKVPGQVFELIVTATPPFDPGAFRKQLTLSTNVEEQPNLPVPVRGSVPQRIDINPAVLNVGRLDATNKLSRKVARVVRVANYGATPVKILGAASSQPEITAKVTEQTEGKSYSVEVVIPKGLQLPTSGRGPVITLNTNDPEKPKIDIPIRALPGRNSQNTYRRPAEALVGKPAPAFTLKTVEGKSIANLDGEGTVKVLDFFAPNCGFCKKQLPRLEKVRADFDGKPVRFVAVSQTMRQKKYSDDQIRSTLQGTGFNGEVAYNNDNSVGKLFKATSFPTMVVIGKSGKVEAVNVGNLGDLETRLTTQLNALIAGKAIPKIAATPVKTPKKPATPRKRPDSLIGKPAPAFATTTFAGKPVSSVDFAKHPATILNFVAGNCGFCKKQLPRVEKIRQKYAAKGVRFVNIAQTMRKEYSKEEITKVMDATGSKLELAQDLKNEIGKKYYATGYPTMVVVGKSGKVEAVNTGNVADLESRMSQQLDALIAGKPIPAIAKAKPPARKRPDSLIGKPAPAFTINTFEGKPVSNAEFVKHPATVLNFVAGNCGYCKKQLPRLEKIRQAYAAKGVRFVNVAQTMRKEYSKDELTKIMDGTGSKLELAQDLKNQVGRKFAATGYPTMVIVGKSGKVEAVNVGNVGNLESRMKKQLDALISGKPIPAIAQAKPPAQQQPGSLIGKPAPAFTTETFAGKKVSSADFAKHPATVLNFVAGNCGFCKKQLPRVEKMRQAYAAKGVRFVNVAQTMRKEFSKEELTKIMDSTGSKLEIAQDAKNSIGQKYGARGFPTMVIVGKSGKVEAINVGNIGDLETRMKAQLDALIAGKPIPATAMAKPRQPQRKRPDSLIGKPAPAFAIKTFEGKPVSNAEFAKHPATILNFVAANCGFCKKQLPRLEKLRQAYAAKGIRFVNVAQTMRKEFSKDELTKIMDGTGSKLEIAQDGKNQVGQKFAATGYPTMVVVGKSGKVEAVNVGNIGDLEKRVKGQLDALIAGKAVPTFASAAPAKRRRPAMDMVGKAAPGFAWKTLEGKPVTNAEIAKHPATVLNFVAPNCGFCKRALPNVEKVRQAYESKGVRFINVAQKMRKDYTNEEIVDVFKKAGSKLEITLSDFAANNTDGRKFQATSYPTMFVLDKNGKISNVNIGAKADLAQMLKGQLDALLKG